MNRSPVQVRLFSTCESCAQQKPDVQFTEGVRDWLCPECRDGVCSEGEYVAEAPLTLCPCARCTAERAARAVEAEKAK